MKVIVTIREFFDKAYDIDKACAVIGLDGWCMKEGTASPDDTITLNEEQLRRLKKVGWDLHGKAD